MLLAVLFSYTACVQKAYKKTVIVTLTVSNKHNIGTAGIRGNGRPLSWEQDYPMSAVIKDSVYKASFTTVTAYKYAEIKFVIDGNFELKDQPNRKIYFDENKDTVYVNEVFDRP